MYAYIEELVQRKAREPGDDLISRLITEYVATGQLDHATTAMNSVIMMQAGHETTANMISLGTVALLGNPEIYARLGQTDDSAVVANIVEELMRYLSIVHSQVDRVATEDLTIAGQLIRAGEFVVMNLPPGTGTPNSWITPNPSTPTETPAGTWASGTACTNASARTWPGSRCRSRSPRWRAACPGSDWRCPRSS